MSLIERIEAASAADHAELDAIDIAIAEWCRAGGAPGLVSYDPDLWLERNDGWVRSIDAAVALAKRVLPWAKVGFAEDAASSWEAWIGAREPFSTRHATPALALVAAVLRAKEGEG